MTSSLFTVDIPLEHLTCAKSDIKNIDAHGGSDLFVAGNNISGGFAAKEARSQALSGGSKDLSSGFSMA